MGIGVGHIGSYICLLGASVIESYVSSVRLRVLKFIQIDCLGKSIQLGSSISSEALPRLALLFKAPTNSSITR